MNIVTTKDNFKNTEEKGLNGKVIRNVTYARKLLSRIDQTPTNILRVIDIKADRDDPTHQRSVVVFENNEKFQEEFAKVLDEGKKNRNDSASLSQQKIEDLEKQVEELKKIIAAKEN